MKKTKHLPCESCRFCSHIDEARAYCDHTQVGGPIDREDAAQCPHYQKETL